MATTVHDTPLNGRPPKFKEEYCEMVVTHMATGMSYETFSAVIGTHRSTLYNWEKQFPQFLDAKKKAVEAGQQFWEQIGLAQAVGDKAYGKGSAASWIFNMKNRFSWADKKDVNVDDNRKKFSLAYDEKETIDAEVVRKELEAPEDDDEL